MRRRTMRAALAHAVDDRPRGGPWSPAVIYRDAEDRRDRNSDGDLDGFRGVLQIDAYAGYIDLARLSRPGVSFPGKCEPL